jgi:hypothetical protein
MMTCVLLTASFRRLFLQVAKMEELDVVLVPLMMIPLLRRYPEHLP